MGFDEDLATVQRLAAPGGPLETYMREIRGEGGDACGVTKARFGSPVSVDYRNLLVRLAVPLTGHGLTESLFGQAVDVVMLRL